MRDAVAEWRTAVALAEGELDPARRAHQASVLRGVKATLEEQMRRLNADSAQLAALKAQVKAVEAGHRHGSRGGGMRPSYGAHDDMDGHDSEHADDDHDHGVGSDPTILGQSRRGSRDVPMNSALRASIEKIGRALEDAITAAEARGAAAAGGGPHMSRSHAGRGLPSRPVRAVSAGRASRGGASMLPLSAMGGGASVGSGLLGGSLLGNRAWGSFGGGAYDLGGASFADDGMSMSSLSALGLHDDFGLGFGGGGGGGGGSSGLGFLERWRDDRDVADSLLHQHSNWLRTFREQVGSWLWGSEPMHRSTTSCTHMRVHVHNRSHPPVFHTHKHNILVQLLSLFWGARSVSL